MRFELLEEPKLRLYIHSEPRAWMGWQGVLIIVIAGSPNVISQRGIWFFLWAAIIWPSIASALVTSSGQEEQFHPYIIFYITIFWRGADVDQSPMNERLKIEEWTVLIFGKTKTPVRCIPTTCPPQLREESILRGLIQSEKYASKFPYRWDIHKTMFTQTNDNTLMKCRNDLNSKVKMWLRIIRFFLHQ